MPRILHWLWFGLAAIMAITLSFSMRYAPVSESNGKVWIWDRWHNRPCMSRVADRERLSLICSFEDAQRADEEALRGR